MSLEIEKAPPEEAANLPNYGLRTKMGEQLLAIRERIVATGAPLLDRDEIEKEVDARRRGFNISQ